MQPVSAAYIIAPSTAAPAVVTAQPGEWPAAGEASVSRASSLSTVTVPSSPVISRVQFTSRIGLGPTVTRFGTAAGELLTFGQGTASQRETILRSEMARMIELPADVKTRINSALAMGLIDQAEQIFNEWEESR
jgi:hypothetical protein